MMVALSISRMSVASRPLEAISFPPLNIIIHPTMAIATRVKVMKADQSDFRMPPPSGLSGASPPTRRIRSSADMAGVVQIDARFGTRRGRTGVVARERLDERGGTI